MNNKNKTITLVSNNYWTLYKFRYDVIEMFVKKGYKVNLIAHKDKYHLNFDSERINKYFIPVEVRSTNILTELKTFISLYNIYKDLKTDIIIHFTIKPNIYGSILARYFKIKSISFITGVGYIFTSKKYFLRKIIALLYRYSLKNNYEVWFTNNSDKMLFLKNKIIDKSQKTDIVPGAGINFCDTLNKNIKKDKSNKIKFLMISRVVKDKGVLEFIKTAQHFKSQAKLEFTLIGSYNKDITGSIDHNILQEAINNKTITYYDYQDNILEYIEQSTCIVQPSYREGISTILLESASLKKPIITTDVPGCIDVIPDNNYGIICKSKDYKSLILAIEKFLTLTTDQIDSMVNNTYKYVKSNFNRKDILKKYEYIISNC
ncbi:MAG: hypothetical protein CMD88_02170 [Gammaproteobacteria bacterium]|nr:hypothetical protein [Gammaproteobacteria bacterium]